MGKAVNGWKKVLMWLGYGLLVPSLAFNLYQYFTNKSGQDTYTVREVVDGDTFVTDVTGRVRLANIDAPEGELCGGKEAKSFLESLVLNEKVRLKFAERDVYNRPLVYAYVEQTMVNEAMLKEGMAEYYTRGGDERIREELKKVYDQAVSDKQGIHAEECTPTKHEADPDCKIKGNIGRDNNTEKVYHFPECNAYDEVIVERFRGEEWFCSEREAQRAGFVKSKNCFGKKY